MYETVQRFLKDSEKNLFENQEFASQINHLKSQVERERHEKEILAKQLKEARDDGRRR